MQKAQGNPSQAEKITLCISKLEKYPRIYDFCIKNQRDTELLALFCTRILKDTRGGTRQGFPAEASEAIFYLANLEDNEPQQLWDFN